MPRSTFCLHLDDILMFFLVCLVLADGIDCRRIWEQPQGTDIYLRQLLFCKVYQEAEDAEGRHAIH